MPSSTEDVRRATETLRAVGRESHPRAEADPVGACLETLRDFAMVVDFYHPTHDEIGERIVRVSAAECYDESAEPPVVQGGQGRELRESSGRAWVFGILAAVVALGIAWALGGWGAFTLGCAAIGCGALSSLATQ